MDNELLKEVIHICRHTGEMNTVSDLLTKPVNCKSTIIKDVDRDIVICLNDGKKCDAEPFMLIPCPEKKGG